MFEMWNVQDVGCWGCSMLEMWDVWDIRDAGCLGCEIFGMWDVRNVGCSRSGMWDVGCFPACGMLIYKILEKME